MDININVTLDSGTTKAVALLAESILAAASELNRTATPVAALAPSTPEEHAATPPKKTRKPRGKPAAKPAAEAAPATENEEPASAPEAAPAAVKITREDVRKAAGAFLEAGNDRADVKDWLLEFGAESITTLDDKHIVEMHGRLTA